MLLKLVNIGGDFLTQRVYCGLHAIFGNKILAECHLQLINLLLHVSDGTILCLLNFPFLALNFAIKPVDLHLN